MYVIYELADNCLYLKLPGVLHELALAFGNYNEISVASIIINNASNTGIQLA